MENKKLFTALTQMTPAIYRDFYKVYYRERLKVFTAVATVIGAALIAAGVYIYKENFGLLWAVIALWLGAFLVVYPRLAYRKPYKRARNARLTTRFVFYEDYVSERTDSVTTDYTYKSLLKAIDTGKYILIFHSSESVSIVDKASVREDAKALCRFLATKTVFKKTVA